MYIKTKGEEPMKKTLAIMLALIMVLALVPTVAFAAGNTIYVDANNGNDTTGDGTETKPYKTVEAAAKAAVSGDTIMLGEGNYTLYGVSSEKTTKTKDLTFVGQGAEKTFWNIGAEVPDPANYGTEYNGDYSFDGAGTITFRNMTLRSGEANYLGFIRADKTIVENCTVNGKTFYWGYTSATFTKTTFNCPAGDYAVWTYSSPIMTFESCTFNSKGKVINVYTDYGAGKYDITVNFKNCTVNNTGESLKPVLNINDSNMDKFKYVLNIAGDNKVNGVDVDNITGSSLFGFGGKEDNNAGKTVVKIDDTTVWQDGNHATGNLTVKKTVTGLPNEILPESFTFEIKQGENTQTVMANREGNDNTYKSETVRLPYGTYTINEVDADVNGFNLNPTGLGEVTIDKEHKEVTVNVTNAYEQLPPNTGTLTVKKTVSGGGADYNKAFKFTVKLEENGDTHNDKVTYGGVTFIDGVATFTLKHNESKTIKGIPAGMTYTVTESDNAGYTVTMSGNTGTIKAGETSTAAFNNYKAGDSGHSYYYPTTTPVPVIVIPPKTGDMTVWQSILHFLGIR